MTLHNAFRTVLTVMLLLGVGWDSVTAQTVQTQRNDIGVGTTTMPVIDTPTSPLSSSSGILAGGFPRTSDTFASRGCSLQALGGNMGTGSYFGANFLMQCDAQDASGRWFQVFQNDFSNQPHDIFSIRREGQVNAQGLQVVQGGYNVNSTTNDSRYMRFNYLKRSITGTSDFAPLEIHSDIPGTFIPIVSIMGMTNVSYGGTRPPLSQNYGSTWLNSALYESVHGSQIDGTLVSSQEDNGNQFSNQLVRTNAVYTNATTTLGNITSLGVPVKNGRTYAITAKLFVTTATGGVKLALASTTTATSIIYEISCRTTTPSLLLESQQTALAGSAGISTSFTGICVIDGTVTMSGGGDTTLAGVATSGSPTLAMTNTAGLAVGMQVTQIGVGCDVIPANTFITAISANTNITMSNNAACTQASINYNFWDTITVQAASNAAGTLTLARGSRLQLNGSINGGAY